MSIAQRPDIWRSEHYKDLEKPVVPIEGSLNEYILGEAAPRMIYSMGREVLDLSGGGQSDVIVLHTSRALTVVKVILLYTEASSADAGVNVKVGKESDDDYFYTGDSEVSKSQWYEKEVTLLNTALAAGDTMICSTAGGKTGTGEVLVLVEATVD